MGAGQDNRLQKKFAAFKESLDDFKGHFAQFGGYVNLPGSMELSIRNQDEVGLPLSERTRNEGDKSNNLASVVYEKSAEFEKFLRAEHSDIFDTVNYDHDFDTGRGGFSYKKENSFNKS